MYNLAVVIKLSRWVQYSSAYGSQFDYGHINKCLKIVTKNKYIKFKVLNLKNFLKTYELFDGVIFVGIVEKTHEFLKSDLKIDKYLWSFNQFDWVNNPEIFNSIKIIFEQSTRNVAKYNNGDAQIIYLPLGFQHDRKINNINPKFDIIYNATLDRSRRLTAKYHRRDILNKLLEAGLKIVLYNGRANTLVEKKLIEPLNRFNNLKVIPKFGEPPLSHNGKYALNIPFHEFGSQKNIDSNWGMDIHDRENGNWLIHWDIFRCIGVKANMITFDCTETKALGLNQNNCHFYKSDTTNLDKMADEIVNIIKKGEVKKIPDDVWEKNTFLARWEFIVNTISKKSPLNFTGNQ